MYSSQLLQQEGMKNSGSIPGLTHKHNSTPRKVNSPTDSDKFAYAKISNSVGEEWDLGAYNGVRVLKNLETLDLPEPSGPTDVAPPPF